MRATYPYLEKFQIIENGDRSVGEESNCPLQVGFFFKEPMEFDDETSAAQLEFLEHIEGMLRRWWSTYSDKTIEGIEVINDTAEKIRSKEAELNDIEY